MSSLKYQPSKASETYYQIWLFFFYQFAEMMTNVIFFLGGGGEGLGGRFGGESVGDFSCLMMDIIPIVVEYSDKVKHRNDIGANMAVLYICLVTYKG